MHLTPGGVVVASVAESLHDSPEGQINPAIFVEGGGVDGRYYDCAVPSVGDVMAADRRFHCGAVDREDRRLFLLIPIDMAPQCVAHVPDAEVESAVLDKRRRQCRPEIAVYSIKRTICREYQRRFPVR